MKRKTKAALKAIREHGRAAIGYVRGSIVTAGLSSAIFGDQLAQVVDPHAPAWGWKIRVCGIVVAGLGTAIKAGEKNQSIDQIQQGLSDRGAVPPPPPPPSKE